MLRTLVATLLLANLLFFAWARGWVAAVAPPPSHGEREPERLQLQVRPELVKLYTGPKAASAAAAATLACLEAGPFNEADAGVAEAALLAAGVPATAYTRRQVEQPASWLVYMGRFADAAALRTKEDELRRLRLAYDEMRAPPELVPGLVLSRHDSRDAAESALAALGQRGVRSARVVASPAAPAQHWLRAEKVEPSLRARFVSLRPPVIAASFGPCR